MTRLRFVVALCALLVGCSKKPEGEGPGEGGPGRAAAKVELKTLAEAPVEHYSDYLATLTSRHSITLYPQISGYVRSIELKPGTLVKQGQVLLTIDARADQATLSNLVATRESQRATAEYSKAQLDRNNTLRSDGIVSQQTVDQARVTADQSEATLKATDALIASQKARLGYYNIVAPFDGELGHVPVKLGDFVTPAVALTSVTQDSGLEAEVWVPIERSLSISPESTIRLLDGEDKPIVESQVTFVAPKADAASQLILIKAAYPANPKLKADQLAHARVIWSRSPGMLAPVPSIVRQAGQTFAYVTEKNDGRLTAKRVAVQLGSLQGGNWEVTNGLDAGQELVVSGVQMVADGAPLEAKK